MGIYNRKKWDLKTCVLSWSIAWSRLYWSLACFLPFFLNLSWSKAYFLSYFFLNLSFFLGRKRVSFFTFSINFLFIPTTGNHGNAGPCCRCDGALDVGMRGIEGRGRFKRSSRTSYHEENGIFGKYRPIYELCLSKVKQLTIKEPQLGYCVRNEVHICTVLFSKKTCIKWKKKIIGQYFSNTQYHCRPPLIKIHFPCKRNNSPVPKNVLIHLYLYLYLYLKMFSSTCTWKCSHPLAWISLHQPQQQAPQSHWTDKSNRFDVAYDIGVQKGGGRRSFAQPLFGTYC